jgi:hypothetical protein
MIIHYREYFVKKYVRKMGFPFRDSRFALPFGPRSLKLVTCDDFRPLVTWSSLSRFALPLLLSRCSCSFGFHFRDLRFTIHLSSGALAEGNLRYLTRFTVSLAHSLDAHSRAQRSQREMGFVFAPDVPENKGTLRQAIPVDSSLLMNPPGK